MSEKKKCIFCDAPANSKEHFWGRWPKKHYLVDPSPKGRNEHPENHLHDDFSITIESGFGAKSGHSLNRTLDNLVCRECNMGWMGDIQEEMSSIFLTIRDAFAYKFTKESAKTVVDWYILKCLLVEASYSLDKWGKPISDALGVTKELTEVARKNRFRFAQSRAIPDNWEVYFSRSPLMNGSMGAQNYVSTLVAGKDECHVLFSCCLFMGHFSAIVTNIRFFFPEQFSIFEKHNLPIVRISPLGVSPVLLDSRRLHQRSIEEIAFQVIENQPALLVGTPLRYNFKY